MVFNGGRAIGAVVGMEADIQLIESPAKGVLFNV